MFFSLPVYVIHKLTLANEVATVINGELLSNGLQKANKMSFNVDKADLFVHLWLR